LHPPLPSEGPQKVFEHPDTGTISVFPPFSDEENIRPHRLVGVRRIVIEKGIVDSKAFDQMVQGYCYALTDVPAAPLSV